MNQKGFANIILIIVIVILVGVVGYFALVKKSPPIAQQTPTPTPTQTKAPVSPTPTPSLPTVTITVKVYFRDSDVIPIDSCGVLVPVTRVIPKTEKVATAAINELLKGPTDAEKSKGYRTDIPSLARLNSLAIVNGEARADFSSSTESGGSCNLTTDQIEKTLLQFSTVKTVTLSVDGRTTGIFQP